MHTFKITASGGFPSYPFRLKIHVVLKFFIYIVGELYELFVVTINLYNLNRQLYYLLDDEQRQLGTKRIKVGCKLNFFVSIFSNVQK